jgi:hypothetical protein
MGGAGGSSRRGDTAAQRRQRLAAELRANIAKRKAQARARARPYAGDDVAGGGGDVPPAGSDGADRPDGTESSRE